MATIEEIIEDQKKCDEKYKSESVMHPKCGMPAKRRGGVYFPQCGCVNDNIQHIGLDKPSLCHMSETEWYHWNGLCAFQA